MSMENHGGMMSTEEHSWLVYQSPLAILPAVIWQQAGGMDERNENLALRSTCVHICKWYCIYRKILRHGTSGFTSLPKEGVLRICIALNIYRPRPGSNPWTLGPAGSMLTITRPWLLPCTFFSVSNTNIRYAFYRFLLPGVPEFSLTSSRVPGTRSLRILGLNVM
jgi:hypothetical protein